MSNVSPPPVNDDVTTGKDKITASWLRFFNALVDASGGGGGGGAVLPVATVYISLANVDPATTLGYGTWELFGTGRMMLDSDPGQPANESSTVSVYMWRRTA